MIIHEKSRSLMAILLVFALFASLNTGAFAANASNSRKYQLESGVVIDPGDTTVNSENVESWAYKDYSGASNTDKANILKARSMMMMQTDWAADGFISYYTAPDGTAEKLPSFSEVFPGWDIKQIWAYRNEVNTLSTTLLRISSSNISILNGSTNNTILSPSYTLILNRSSDHTVPIPAASTTENAPTAFSMAMETGVHQYETKVTSLNVSASCNIGHSIFSTTDGIIDVAYLESLPVGGKLSTLCIDNYTTNDHFLVRVSTWSTPGTGQFNLSDYIAR